MPKRSGLLEDVISSDLVDDPARDAASEPHRAAATVRRRRRWGKDATLGAITLGAIGGFLALARVIASPTGSPFDRAVVHGMGRARSPATNALARGITSLGGVPGAAAISLGALALVGARPRLGAQIATGALGGSIAELVMKRFFRRKRPTILAHLEHVASTSFPSGHAMAAASLYLTLAFVASRNRRLRDRRGALVTGAGALATSIGATRVYLGVHWPTDVLGGLALGTAWACLTEAVFDLTGADRVEREVARLEPSLPAT